MLRTPRQLIGEYLSPKQKKKLSLFYKQFSLERRSQEKLADVFVISFPKSGRTWLNLLIGVAIRNYYQLPQADLLNVYELSAFNTKIPRVLFTHDDEPHRKKPYQLQESKEKYRHKQVILLVRDPRAIIVSLYFHRVKREKTFTGSLQEFLLYEEWGGIHSLLRFYQIWDANKQVPEEFLLLRYEDLHINPQRELRRVLDFMGLANIPDAVLEKTITYCSFDNMQSMEAQGLFSSKKLTPKDKNDKQSYKVRQGKVDGFLDHLDDSQRAYLDTQLSQYLPDIYGYKPSVSSNIMSSVSARTSE